MSQRPTAGRLARQDTASIRQRIRAFGLRATPGRIAVIGVLLDAARPMTHADLAEQLEPQGFDRASLFRNLADLTDARLIARTDLGDHVWRFYLADLEAPAGGDVQHAEHPHFVCISCNRTMCLDDVEIVIRTGPQAPRSLREHTTEVNLRGLCDACNDARQQ